MRIPLLTTVHFTLYTVSASASAAVIAAAIVAAAAAAVVSVSSAVVAVANVHQKNEDKDPAAAVSTEIKT